MGRGCLIESLINFLSRFFRHKISLTSIWIYTLTLDCTCFLCRFALFDGIINSWSLIVDVSLGALPVEPCTNIELQLHLASHMVYQRLEVDSLFVACVAFEFGNQKICGHKYTLENIIENSTFD